MAKSKTLYICNQCEYESVKWNGRCPSCGAWNSFEEHSPSSSAPVSQYIKTDLLKPTKNTEKKSITEFSDIKSLEKIDIKTDEIRYETGLSEFDRVLGGGLVKGSLVLLGGEPGIGKSTILLQICEYLGKNLKILYVSGEESSRQIKLRAERLGVKTQNLFILTITDAVAICETVLKSEPDIVIIDSIQTMSIPQITSTAGSITQVRECTNLFMKTAKTAEIPFVLVGHVNKDGAVAGPKVTEHIVDAVLYFEGQKNLSYRILRAVKNRFGSTNEIGVFEMVEKGLQEVKNPSALFLSGRPHDVSGSCVACILEGSRPILAEVQALATKSNFATPKRTSTGFDYNRASIILAVLEKRLGFAFSSLDVYINIVGGLYLDDTAGDLPVAMALYSCLTDKCIDENLIAIGEIGLGGEIRNVSQLEKRLQEAQRLGFTTAIIPSQSKINEKDYNIKIVQASYLKQVFNLMSK